MIEEISVFDLFKNDIITIVSGGLGTGKTTFVAGCLAEYIFDRERIKKMHAEIDKLNSVGFKLSYPEHCVFTSMNFPLSVKKFRRTPRNSYLINPFRLGFHNKYVKTQFLVPYAVIGVDEAQEVYNSRMSMYYPSWHSRAHEALRHYDIKLFLIAQRGMMFDENIRDIACFVETQNLIPIKDKFGRVIEVHSIVRKFENSTKWDKYKNSSKEDNSLYKEYLVKFNCNVFSFFDTKALRYKFLKGHFNHDFDLVKSTFFELSKQSIYKYLEKLDDEKPKDFYVKRSEM